MERIRGSAEIGITREGNTNLAKTAKQILSRGIPWKVYMAGDQRSLQSAFTVVLQGSPALVMALQTADEDWDTWHLGGFEGQPAAKVQQVIDELRLKTPWVVPIGKGALSEHPGESFNQFKARVINRLWKLIAEIRKNPGKLIHVITHDSVLILINAYLKRYQGRPEPTDVNYDLATYVKENEEPGTPYWFRGCFHKPFKLDVILDSDTFPLTEVVFWRHAPTSWNAPSGDNGTKD